MSRRSPGLHAESSDAMSSPSRAHFLDIGADFFRKIRNLVDEVILVARNAFAAY